MMMMMMMITIKRGDNERSAVSCRRNHSEEVTSEVRTGNGKVFFFFFSHFAWVFLCSFTFYFHENAKYWL